MRLASNSKKVHLKFSEMDENSRDLVSGEILEEFLYNRWAMATVRKVLGDLIMAEQFERANF
jgi:hypothetical protein